MGFWSTVAAIVWKDLRAELRSRETAGTSLVFALLAILTFSFALDPTRIDPSSVAPGVLWVTVFFAGMLALGRSMGVEQASGALQGLLASPAEPEAVFAGKLLANWVFSVMVEAVSVPVLLALFRVGAPREWGWFLAVLMLGTTGFVSVGTLFATIAAGSRARELMLPLLLLPVAVPVAIAAVEATGALMSNLSAADWQPWVRMLAVYDVVMLAAPQLLFRFLLEG
ncbi:heme exporter protein CcmB [Carboxydochorda subterranea]|uniref:Heme exporter protein B n=1 Tax=Carboxydichorda subterranea TaxID=3109565 RepID=A0ABZ1C094_9FIRM|nr:heme exporter protein CcmB [Limnochorda sp. L945t]WRP17767.1 heme exporter protein CcmB [Limnochorda sp. L945t]